MARIRRWTPYRNSAGTTVGFISAELPSGADRQRVEGHGRPERSTLGRGAGDQTA